MMLERSWGILARFRHIPTNGLNFFVTAKLVNGPTTTSTDADSVTVTAMAFVNLSNNDKTTPWKTAPATTTLIKNKRRKQRLTAPYFGNIFR